jgi:hypothetical protein
MILTPVPLLDAAGRKLVARFAVPSLRPRERNLAGSEGYAAFAVFFGVVFVVDSPSPADKAGRPKDDIWIEGDCIGSILGKPSFF